MQYDEHPYVVPAWEALDHEVGTPMCEVPFHRMFIGYDGRYHLCSSDWEKRAKVGSVFEGSLLEATQERTLRAADRSPVCHCSWIQRTGSPRLAEAEDGAVDQASVDEARRAAVARAEVCPCSRRLGATIPAGTRRSAHEPAYLSSPRTPPSISSVWFTGRSSAQCFGWAGPTRSPLAPRSSSTSFDGPLTV